MTGPRHAAPGPGPETGRVADHRRGLVPQAMAAAAERRARDETLRNQQLGAIGEVLRLVGRISSDSDARYVLIQAQSEPELVARALERVFGARDTHAADLDPRWLEYLDWVMDFLPRQDTEQAVALMRDILWGGQTGGPTSGEVRGAGGEVLVWAFPEKSSYCLIGNAQTPASGPEQIDNQD